MTVPPWQFDGDATYSISAGTTVRQLYWYWTTDPSGNQVGGWQGPQMALPVPVQLLTESGHVHATGQGFQVNGPLDIQYTVDMTNDDPEEDGYYTIWAGGVL